MIPKQITNLEKRIREHLDSGRFRDTTHYLENIRTKPDRNFTRQEVHYVLRNGSRERDRDRFEEKYNSWSYAIRGQTLDKDKELRVIVSFDPDDMLIVTAYRVSKKRSR